MVYWYIIVWYGIIRYIVVWHIIVWPGVAWYGTNRMILHSGSKAHDKANSRNQGLEAHCVSVVVWAAMSSGFHVASAENLCLTSHENFCVLDPVRLQANA